MTKNHVEVGIKPAASVAKEESSTSTNGGKGSSGKPSTICCTTLPFLVLCMTCLQAIPQFIQPLNSNSMSGDQRVRKDLFND